MSTSRGRIEHLPTDVQEEGAQLTYEQTLARWYELKQTIAHLQAEERTLREGLFQGTFPDPKEGVNTHKLEDGTQVKGTYRLNRKVDVEEWEKIRPILTAEEEENVFKVSVSLMTGAYKKLADDRVAIIDKCLTITPGLPSLDVKPPKGGSSVLGIR